MMGDSEKFLKILRVELEDLEGRLEHLVEQYKDRQDHHEVSAHLSEGNAAVFRNEQLALVHLRKIIDAVVPDEHPDLDQLVIWLGDRFEEELRIAGLSLGANFFAKRKMKSVQRYVTDRCDS